MSKKTVRVGISAFVLVSALSWLMYSTISEGAEYFKTVDEVVANPADWQGKRLHVWGHVQGDPLVNVKTLQYRFTIHANGKTIDAEYTGVVPDTFKAGAEVVVKGRLGDDGKVHIQPDGITAKCPSKYEAERGRPTIGG